MNEIYTTSFEPESGKVVEAPNEIERITTDRVGSPQIGYGTLKVGIVGTGEPVEYVVLSDTNGEIEVEDGSQFLTVGTAAEKSFYMIPRSEY